MDDSQRLPWRNRPLAAGTLDERALLVVPLVGNENGSTAQIALTERAPAAIRYRIRHWGIP